MAIHERGGQNCGRAERLNLHIANQKKNKIYTKSPNVYIKQFHIMKSFQRKYEYFFKMKKRTYIRV